MRQRFDPERVEGSFRGGFGVEGLYKYRLLAKFDLGWILVDFGCKLLI